MESYRRRFPRVRMVVNGDRQHQARAASFFLWLCVCVCQFVRPAPPSLDGLGFVPISSPTRGVGALVGVLRGRDGCFVSGTSARVGRV